MSNNLDIRILKTFNPFVWSGTMPSVMNCLARNNALGYENRKVRNFKVNQRDEKSRKGKLRIILLEDNDNVRSVLTMMLTHRGYEVFSFPKPTVCPLQLQPACRCNHNQSCTDVILTDLDMPEMDGLRFIGNLKKKNCKCRHIAVMSGSLTADAMFLAVKLGCSAFEKPFDKEVLFQWLDGIEKQLHPSRELCNWFRE
jgi:CheY-like chemotaxis protein